MAYQFIFERCELKYIITKSQKEKIMRVMEPYMALDEYGRTVIRNIYFDTDNYRLVRKSIEKPIYKEKLRIRSYERVNPNGTVFVELKKKFEDTVYKRRVSLPCQTAMDRMRGICSCGIKSQISDEIDYFLSYYGTIHPVAFLSYEREAFFSLGGDDFRITFDDTVLCRPDELSLTSDVHGTPILEEGLTLMEIKCRGGIPIWMVRALSEEHIYKTSFSKYGTAYQKIIYPQLKEVYACV